MPLTPDKRPSSFHRKTAKNISLQPVPAEEYWGNRAMLLERVRLCLEDEDHYQRYVESKTGNPNVITFFSKTAIQIVVSDLRYFRRGHDCFFYNRAEAPYLAIVLGNGVIMNIRHIGRPEQIRDILIPALLQKKILL